MLEHALQWVELAVRWIHVITGIAWIGTSFYFNWLNDNFRPPSEPRPGVSGELWQVHGGGFYQVLKYRVAPEELPGTLHWFKWEAYSTWLSGFALLMLVYYLGADLYLLQPDGPISAPAAIGLGLGTLTAGWIIYDLLCRSALLDRPVAFTALGFVLVTGLAFGLTQVFSSRGAYMHVGALLGTIMAANVFFVIIPNQQKMVRAMQRGQAPDAEEGRRAALRSRHNNYITLPVLFVMISSHYPMTYEHRYNWAILAGLSLVGAGVRHWFNLKHMGRRNVWILPAAALGMVGLGFVTAPKQASPQTNVEAGDVDFERVATIVSRRCVECHSSSPTSEMFTAPPAGITLESPAQIGKRADRIHRVVVQSKIMPPGNITGMSPKERELIDRWYRGGARVPR